MTNDLVQADFPLLYTEHCVLRRIEQSDRPAVFAGLSQHQVTAHYGISYQTEAATQEQINWYRQLEQDQTGLWWAICLKDQPDQLIGACGIYERDQYNQNADIGYWLLPSHWGRSVMRECLQQILTYAFKEMLMHRIEAEVDPANQASILLLERLGFQVEGRRRQVAWREDHFIDLCYFSLLKDEFRNLKI